MINTQNISNLFKGDKSLWFIILFLYAISIISVYSSVEQDYFLRGVSIIKLYGFHTLYLIIGLFVIVLVHRVNYNYIAGLYKIMLPLSILLLIYASIGGKEINEASRWISLPGGISFQPSEFAKIAIFSFIARHLSKNQNSIDNYAKILYPILSVLAIIVFLVFMENFSTSVIIIIIALVMLYIGRVRLKHLSVLFFSGLIVAFVIIVLMFTLPEKFLVFRLATAKNRITEFMSKKDNNDVQYQVKQSYIAIANGDLVNFRPGKSLQKNFLPKSHSDYIFSIIIEEWGLLGGLIVLILYMILFYRVMVIVKQTENTFGALLSLSLGLGIVLQAFAHMLITVGLLPATGITLPLISMGGSSILFTDISLGLILSVSNYSDKKIGNEAIINSQILDELEEDINQILNNNKNIESN